METALVWSAGVAALLLCAGVLAVLRPDTAVFNARSSALGLILAALGFVVALPERAPWHAGQGLGWGVALGAVGAVLALNAAAVGRDPTDRSRAILACAAAMAAGVAPVATVVVTLWSQRLDALMGLMLGWVTVAQAIGLRQPRADTRSAAGVFATATVFAGFLALACALSAFRGATPAHARLWAASSLAIGGSVPLALLIGAVCTRYAATASLALPGALAALSVGLTAWAVVLRVAAPLPGTQFPEGLFWCSILGLLSGSVIGALVSTGGRSVGYAPIAALVAAAAALSAFQLMAGLGVAVTGIGMTAYAGLLVAASRPDDGRPERTREAFLGPAAMILAIAASRVAIERYSSLTRPFTLSDHYTIVMFLLGLFVPSVLARWSAASATWRGPIAALAALLWPALIIGIWGPKAVFPLIVGIGLAVLWARAADEGLEPLTVVLIAVGGIFSLLQFTEFGASYSELTRLDRARLIALIGGASAALALASELARTRFRRSG